MMYYIIMSWWKLSWPLYDYEVNDDDDDDDCGDDWCLAYQTCLKSHMMRMIMMTLTIIWRNLSNQILLPRKTSKSQKFSTLITPKLPQPNNFSDDDSGCFHSDGDVYGKHITPTCDDISGDGDGGFCIVCNVRQIHCWVHCCNWLNGNQCIAIWVQCLNSIWYNVVQCTLLDETSTLQCMRFSRVECKQLNGGQRVVIVLDRNNGHFDDDSHGNDDLCQMFDFHCGANCNLIGLISNVLLTMMMMMVMMMMIKRWIRVPDVVIAGQRQSTIGNCQQKDFHHDLSDDEFGDDDLDDYDHN